MATAPAPLAASRLALVRPTWMDPRYIVAVNDATVTPFTLASANPERCLRANPTRWAFGVGVRVGTVAGAVIAPHGRPDLGGWILPAGPDVLWFDAVTFGPFVCREWFLDGTAGNIFDFYEVVIKAEVPSDA